MRSSSMNGKLTMSSRSLNVSMASKAMKLKLSGNISREVTERKQVGDTESMFGGGDIKAPWWRNVGMEEDV